MTSGEPPRWQRLAWRRVASVAGVVLVTAVLLALGVSRDRADETEPPVAAPATTPAAAPVASPPLTPSAPATLPPSRTPPASVTPPASATPSASVTASPATGLLPVVSVSPGGPEVPRLATLTVSFRDPPRETAGARLVSIARQSTGPSPGLMTARSSSSPPSRAGSVASATSCPSAPRRQASHVTIGTPSRSRAGWRSPT